MGKKKKNSRQSVVCHNKSNNDVVEVCAARRINREKTSRDKQYETAQPVLVMQHDK
jgi:hypothetical protein